MLVSMGAPAAMWMRCSGVSELELSTSGGRVKKAGCRVKKVCCRVKKVGCRVKKVS